MAQDNNSLVQQLKEIQETGTVRVWRGVQGQELVLTCPSSAPPLSLSPGESDCHEEGGVRGACGEQDAAEKGGKAENDVPRNHCGAKPHAGKWGQS
jgi:hypothetical protein